MPIRRSLSAGGPWPPPGPGRAEGGAVPLGGGGGGMGGPLIRGAGPGVGTRTWGGPPGVQEGGGQSGNSRGVFGRPGRQGVTTPRRRRGREGSPPGRVRT